MRIAILSIVLASPWLSAAGFADRAFPFEGFDLAILPLGDSITYGSHSSDGNGYRQYVYDTIAHKNAVTMVGSVHSGSMADNANEGHPGWTILDIYGQAEQDFSAAPNVVLFMAGTNNIIQGLNCSVAHELVSEMTDQLVKNLPDAIILVAHLTPMQDESWETQRVIFNEKLTPLLEEKKRAGKKVLGVDMDGLIRETDMMPDGIHPNDAGYAKLAQAWLAALGEVHRMGWFPNHSRGVVVTTSSNRLRKWWN